ncbi:MAG: hypothetical protein J6V13_01380 [Paludibacteraceae bacterium]|nr:hypothetical protein [Paludibacteraceae bacterium]
MERILTSILKRFYWLLIYIFTAAGSVSLKDDMFGVREQFKSWKSAGYETVNAASADDDIKAEKAKTCDTYVCSFDYVEDTIDHLREYLCQLANLAARLFDGVFSCPEAHRIRLRVCSD